MSTKSCTSVVASNHVCERERSDYKFGRSEQLSLVKRKEGKGGKTDKKSKGPRTKRKRKKKRKKEKKKEGHKVQKKG